MQKSHWTARWHCPNSNPTEQQDDIVLTLTLLDSKTTLPYPNPTEQQDDIVLTLTLLDSKTTLS